MQVILSIKMLNLNALQKSLKCMKDMDAKPMTKKLKMQLIA